VEAPLGGAERYEIRSLPVGPITNVSGRRIGTGHFLNSTIKIILVAPFWFGLDIGRDSWLAIRPRERVWMDGPEGGSGGWQVGGSSRIFRIVKIPDRTVIKLRSTTAMGQLDLAVAVRFF